MQTPELSRDAEVVAIAPQVGQASVVAEVKITTAAQFTDAGNWLRTIKGLRAKIEAARVRITQPMNQALRAVNEQAREQDAPLLTAETKIKRGMGEYTAEQDRLRREEQRKADERARKEQGALQAKAATAAAKGKTERAPELQHAASTVVAPVIQREPPKVAGIVMREAWKFEVTDPALVPREYLSVDEKKIRAVVQALKGDAKIPGVRVYSEQQVAAGAA